MEKDVLKDSWKQLAEAPPNKRMEAFRQYCQKAVALYEQKELFLEDAAYAIAGAMQFDELEADPKADEIIELAGELELPSEHYVGDKKAGWQKLAALVQGL